jgi:hypothetical protein
MDFPPKPMQAQARKVKYTRTGDICHHDDIFFPDFQNFTLQ